MQARKSERAPGLVAATTSTMRGSSRHMTIDEREDHPTRNAEAKRRTRTANGHHGTRGSGSTSERPSMSSSTVRSKRGKWSDLPAFTP